MATRRRSPHAARPCIARAGPGWVRSREQGWVYSGERRSEGAPLQDVLLEDGEHALDLVQPGGVLGREVPRPAWMLVEPVEHVVGVVRGQIVADDMPAPGRVAGVDDVEQLDEGCPAVAGASEVEQL